MGLANREEGLRSQEADQVAVAVAFLLGPGVSALIRVLLSEIVCFLTVEARKRCPQPQLGVPGDLQRLPDTRLEADSMAEGRARALLVLGHSQLPLPSKNPMEKSPPW